MISTYSKNIYYNVKKSRPLNPPESYISKAFITSENIFDFGPLCIGKDPTKRNEADLKKVNSTTIRLSNLGKFATNIEVALKSSVVENDPKMRKGVFWIEPEKMFIEKGDELPLELRVWAIPDME